jgi:hypothetical protein
MTLDEKYENYNPTEGGRGCFYMGVVKSPQIPETKRTF